MTEINFIAVLVSAIASFMLGAVWYSPVLFMQRWCQETGVDPAGSIDNPARVYGNTFVLTLISALALALLLGPAPELTTAILSSVVVGVGMIATSMGINYQFALRSLIHWLIDSGFHVARFLVIGLILGLWH